MHSSHSSKLIAVATAVLLAVLVVCASAQDETLDKAKRAFQSKRYAEAATHFRAITEEFPDWSYGFFYLGLSQKNAGQFDQAARSFKRASDLANNENEMFGASLELADTYYRKQDYRNAIKYILEAKRRKSANRYNANRKNMRTIEGISRYHQGQYQQAINIFKPEVDSGNASANVLRTVAKCYQGLNQNSRAVSVIKLAVKKDPNDLAAHLILVKSQLNTSNWSEGVSSAEYALQYHDRNWELHYLKGRAQYKLGRLRAAVSSLRTSLSIRHQDKVSKLLGDVYRDQGEYLKATDAYNTAQRSYTDDPGFYTSFAYA